MTENLVTVTSSRNNVIVYSPGPQGPRGRTILNGVGAPSNNLGLTGDYYYNTATTDFYGPKLSDLTWSGATIIKFIQEGSDYSYTTSWAINQVLYDNVDNNWYVDLTHNLDFYPNVTVKTSAGDILETGIDYNSTNTIRLTMAQPFAGTAYLS
jgi:hypothetical protein